MEIRRVTDTDLPEIKRIADSLVVTPEHLDREMGFFDYSLSLEQYQRRAKSRLFLVSSHASELQGFCMAYDSNFVRMLTEQEPQLEEDVVFSYLSSLRENYSYIDQLAVRTPNSFMGSLSACQLITRLKDPVIGGSCLIGVTPHFPWKNKTSIRFYTHQGAKLVREIGSRDKIIFGVYSLSLV